MRQFLIGFLIASVPALASAQSFTPVSPYSLKQAFGVPGYVAGVDASGNLQPPSSTVRGGVTSVTAPTHEFLNSISTSGTPGYAQPSAADISGLAPSATTDTTNASNITSGTLPSGRIPVPGSSTLGGVLSATAPTNQFQTGVSTAGAPQFAQPSFGNLSGTATPAQLPAATTSSIGAVQVGTGLSVSGGTVSLPSVNTSGAGTFGNITTDAQGRITAVHAPGFTDLSGTAALAQLPTIPASQTSGLLPLTGGSLSGPISTVGSLTIGDVFTEYGLPSPVNSLTLVTGGAYQAIPTITITAPTSGTQATAVVSALGMLSLSLNTGGSGYTTGDTCSLVGGTGTAATFGITVVGGVITEVSGRTAGSYTVLPAQPTAISCSGGGTGGTVTTSFYVQSTSMTVNGSGYTSVPAVTFV